MTISAARIRALVEPNRIHRNVYVDEEIFRIEMEKIWGYAWIYIGHDSQIPEAGDFITTDLGLDPVIMVRGDDAKVRVLFNRCAHKGAKVTGRACGHADSFRCPYHGLQWNHDGNLRHNPFDWDMPQWGECGANLVDRRCFGGSRLLLRHVDRRGLQSFRIGIGATKNG